jgi:hypothetical protein
MVNTKQQLLEDINYTLNAIFSRSGKAGRDSKGTYKNNTIKIKIYK